jgi:hypothetical protein
MKTFKALTLIHVFHDLGLSYNYEAVLIAVGSIQTIFLCVSSQSLEDTAR